MAEHFSGVVVTEAEVQEVEIGDATGDIVCGDADSLGDDAFQAPQVLRILRSAEQQR